MGANDINTSFVEIYWELWGVKKIGKSKFKQALHIYHLYWLRQILSPQERQFLKYQNINIQIILSFQASIMNEPSLLKSFYTGDQVKKIWNSPYLPSFTFVSQRYSLLRPNAQHRVLNIFFNRLTGSILAVTVHRRDSDSDSVRRCKSTF